MKSQQRFPSSRANTYERTTIQMDADESQVPADDSRNHHHARLERNNSFATMLKKGRTASRDSLDSQFSDEENTQASNGSTADPTSDSSNVEAKTNERPKVLI